MPVKDLLATSRALHTWTEEAMRQLGSRGGCAVTVVDNAVGKEAEEDVEQLLAQFLTEVTKSSPAVALIWVPKEVDKKRKQRG